MSQRRKNKREDNIFAPYFEALPRLIFSAKESREIWLCYQSEGYGEGTEAIEAYILECAMERTLLTLGKLVDRDLATVSLLQLINTIKKDPLAFRDDIRRMGNHWGEQFGSSEMEELMKRLEDDLNYFRKDSDVRQLIKVRSNLIAHQNLNAVNGPRSAMACLTLSSEQIDTLIISCEEKFRFYEYIFRKGSNEFVVRESLVQFKKKFFKQP